MHSIWWFHKISTSNIIFQMKRRNSNVFSILSVIPKLNFFIENGLACTMLLRNKRARIAVSISRIPCDSIFADRMWVHRNTTQPIDFAQVLWVALTFDASLWLTHNLVVNTEMIWVFHGTQRSRYTRNRWNHAICSRIFYQCILQKHIYMSYILYDHRLQCRIN